MNFFLSPAEDIANENILKPNELITAVLLDAPKAKTKSYYIKQVARESYDWSLADVAVVAEVSGKKCEKIAITLGAASPVPMHSEPAERMMTQSTYQRAKCRSRCQGRNGTGPAFIDECVQGPVVRSNY